MATATSGKQTLPAINQQTWRQRISSYKRTPLSFLLFLLVSLSTVATVAVLVLLVGYILIKGIPNLNPALFAWTYNSVGYYPQFKRNCRWRCCSRLLLQHGGICGGQLPGK